MTSRYLKDPVIICCAVGWFLAVVLVLRQLILFLLTIPVPISPGVALATPININMPPASTVAQRPSIPAPPAMSAPPQALGGPVVAPALHSFFGGNFGVATNPHRQAGKVLVGKGADFDTDDLDKALTIVSLGETIELGPGTFRLNSINPAGYAGLEFVTIVGSGTNSVVRFARGPLVRPRLRLESLAIEGDGRFAIEVDGGELDLRNVHVRDSFEGGISLGGQSVLNADQVTIEGAADFCLRLDGASSAKLQQASFIGCNLGVRVASAGTLSLSDGIFRKMPSAFLVVPPPDRPFRAQGCSYCTFGTGVRASRDPSQVDLYKPVFESREESP